MKAIGKKDPSSMQCAKNARYPPKRKRIPATKEKHPENFSGTKTRFKVLDLFQPEEPQPG